LSPLENGAFHRWKVKGQNSENFLLDLATVVSRKHPSCHDRNPQAPRARFETSASLPGGGIASLDYLPLSYKY
jgi:hypothetical protein